MIRRISKKNDLKDLIKSCPSGVIDDITEIRYFISGHPETEIVATFKKVGTHLEAILPTSDLATLSNGVLMRRALYKVADSSYPDGYYNLEFVDNLDVWLGDEETQDPFDPGYLTEEDLKTLNGESLVGVGNIDVVNYIPDYYATKSWVSNQGYLTSHQDLSSYITHRICNRTVGKFKLPFINCTHRICHRILGSVTGIPYKSSGFKFLCNKVLGSVTGLYHKCRTFRTCNTELG